MKSRSKFLIYFLLIFMLTGSACSLASHLAERVVKPSQPDITRLRRLPTWPAATPIRGTDQLPQTGNDQPDIEPNVPPEQTLSPTLPPAPHQTNLETNPDVLPVDDSEQVITSTLSSPLTLDSSEAAEPASTPAVPGPEQPPLPTSTPDLPLDVFKGTEYAGPTPVRRRPKPTPTPGLLPELAAQLLAALREPAVTPTSTRLPTFTPTPTPTDTPTPTATPTATPTPTGTPTPTDTPIPTNTPLPTATPTPTDTPTNTPVPPPTATPPPTNTPVPEYDFLLAEFYNSPTTNSFLVIYVAIVDPNEIPIGDMKIVGTRLDYNLTYESPLSTWYYEGYNAPGEVIKSGNVKFEPPGGIETTSWVLHLEDAQGNRQSDDIQFDVDQNNKQWYFIRLKRKF